MEGITLVEMVIQRRKRVFVDQNMSNMTASVRCF